MSFRIDVIANRGRSPQTLLRQSWREGKRVRHKTIANLTKLPPHVVDGIRAILKGGVVFERIDDALAIERSLPHGHVAAALAVARKRQLPRILDRSSSRHASLALAALVARVVEPASKLATARQLSPDTASSSLGTVLDLGPVRGNELLDMLDWLLDRQRHIETSLANRHLRDGTLILYDVSSSYLEGRCCHLAAFGHNRDGKIGKKQIVHGLLCAPDGCPVAVEVFAGNTADPVTVASQVARIRKRFRIQQVALVGDRGMLTTARIRDDLQGAGLDWISALRSRDIRKLLDRAPDNARLEDMDDDAVAEVASEDFPGERLMVCLNPRLRKERARKRNDLLEATENVLREIARTAARARPGPDNRDRINKALGARANRWKMRKHFRIKVRDDALIWERDRAAVADEARLDGLYVIRTSLDPDSVSPAQAVDAYKSLARIERAFRNLKASRLEIRPVFVRTVDHVRAHVFLCMLALHLEWHMRQVLAPMLFEDDDREAARASRASPVEKAQTSQSAKLKADTKTTADGMPVHSMTTLLADLATMTLNKVSLPGRPDSAFHTVAKPTPVQAKAFELLEVKPEALAHA